MGTPATLSRFSGVQELEVDRFLLRVLRKPEMLEQHLRLYALLMICTKDLADVLQVSRGHYTPDDLRLYR